MTRNTRFLRIALLVAVVGALALVPAALAGKGGGGKPSGGGGSTTSSTLAVKMVVDQNGDNAPNWNDQITFSFSPPSTNNPYVNVRCYQGTAFVFDSWVGYYVGSWTDQSFTLRSTYWSAGEATCTARLVMYSKQGAERTLESLNFSVGA